MRDIFTRDQDSRQRHQDSRSFSSACALWAVFSALSLILASLAVASSWDPEKKLKAFLLENYPWEDLEIRNIQVLGASREELPERIIVEKGPIGKSLFSFIFKGNRRALIKANIRVFDRVVKSKRPFKRGHVLQKGDIYIAKMDIRKMPKSSVKDPASIVGKSLKRSIIANIPISEDMVEKSKVVKRGKRVVLMINMKGLHITAIGKTKEKGYVGMPIKAINLSSKKEVRGVLTDENTVEVEL